MHWSRTVPRGEGGICSGHVCTHVYTYVYLVYRSSTTRSSWNSGPVLLQNIRVKQKKWGGRRNSALLKNWDTDKKSFLSSEKGVGVHTTKERMEMLVSHMSSNVWKRKEKYSNFFDHSHSSECIVEGRLVASGHLGRHGLRQYKLVLLLQDTLDCQCPSYKM